MMLRNFTALFLTIVLLPPFFAAENLKAVGGVAKVNVKAIGAVAEANVKAFGAVDNTSASCGTADSPLAGDELKYGWEAGDTGTWTSWVGTDTVAFDQAFNTSALTANKPTGACNLGVQLTVANTSGDESIYWNRGSAVTIASQVTDIYFYLYVTTPLDNTENFTLMSINTSATGSGSITTWVNIRNSGGTMQVNGEGSNSSTWGNLTASQWNQVRVHIQDGAGNSYVSVNGGANQTFTHNGTQWQYIHIGAVQNHSINEAFVGVMDVVVVNTP
jgi:hypothetical protein